MEILAQKKGVSVQTPPFSFKAIKLLLDDQALSVYITVNKDVHEVYT